MADEVELKHVKKKKVKNKLEKRKADLSPVQDDSESPSKLKKTEGTSRRVCLGVQGWCSGESTHLPPMWLVLNSQILHHMWLEFVGSLLYGCPFTLSIALPGSILDNAQSPELKTYLAGQIARALAVFRIDEVIIFDEYGKAQSGFKRNSDPNILLARILQYLECPQYLRKNFFPKHDDLQYAGILNPLDTPHHMKIDDDMPFRDGVVLDRPVKNGCGSFVNAGMRKEVRIDKNLKPGLRVTVKMGDTSKPGAKFYSGTVVSPSSPRTEHGLHWGYSVRVAPSFGAIFTQSPYKDGYDVTIGTSERGTPVDDLELPNFRHLLVVFGGLKGLEASLESDEQLTVNEPSLVFDHYVNTCPGQGSGTIRTEEAILVTMSALRPMIASATNWKPDISNSA